MNELSEDCPVCHTRHLSGTQTPYGTDGELYYAHLLFLMQDWINRKVHD